MAGIESRIAHWLVRHARLLFWLGLAIAVVATTGFSRMTLRNDYRSFFDLGDPILERTDKLSERMGNSRETAIILYRPQDGNALSAVSVLQYGQLADQATSLPFVTKAESWYDAEKVIALPGKDESGRPRRALVPFPEGADLFTPEGLELLSKDIAYTPTINGRFIARDRSSATVMLQIDLTSTPGSRVAKLEKLEQEVSRIEKDLQRVAPGDQLLLVGSTLFDYTSTQVLRADVKRLFPIALAIILFTIHYLYRSYKFTALAMLLIVLPVAATGGAIAAAGFEFSTLTVSALLLVGTLAVADILHIANSFFLISATQSDEQSMGLTNPPITPATALTQALSKNFWAITATSSTTAVGEIALLFSSAPPVRVMGITVIVGVFIAWMLAVMMLPWVLLHIRNVKRGGASMLSSPLARLSIACARRPWPVLGSFAVLMIVSAYGISLSRVDDSMSAWFSKETRFRQGMDMLDDQYLGLRTMTLATRVDDQDRTIADSREEAIPVRAHYAKVQDRLSEATDGYWLSAVTASREFAKRMSQPGPTGFRPDPAMISENPSPLSSRVLSDAGLMTQFEPGKLDYAVAYFDPKGTTTFETLRAADRIVSVARSAAPDRDPQVQGVSLAFASLSARNFYSMITGSVAAFAIMTASLMVVFGSWRMGLLSMIPNLAPLVVVYGLWGFLDGRINMAAVSVFSVACGIIVDDTIHLVLMYRRYRAAGASVHDAVGHAMESSGTGVLATTIVIAAGFFLLGFSDFHLTAQKAMMVGGAITIAFFFDLLAMPALLAIVDQIGSRLRSSRSRGTSPSIQS